MLCLKRNIFLTIIATAILSVFFTTLQYFNIKSQGPLYESEETRQLHIRGDYRDSIDYSGNANSSSSKSVQMTSPNIPVDIHSSIENASCENGSKKNLMFLKTHKTGSSTLQNIIVRKAYSMKAFIGLPQVDILFGYLHGYTFHRKLMKPTPKNKSVNMLVHHMIFNKTEVQKILPPDSIYVTILREPVSQFESVFNYLKTEVAVFKRVHKSMGVGEFLNRPWRYFQGKEPSRFWWFGKNNVMFDLGFDNLNNSDEYISESIKQIEKTFHLVMISEYFDMSVLLMKDLMCWDIKDVVYLSMNARSNSSVTKLTKATEDRIRKWNKADAKLYEHFNRTFWQKVREYGEERMKRDLLELKTLTREMTEYCVEDNRVSSSKVKNAMYRMYAPRDGVDISQYMLKPSAEKNKTCIEFILPESRWRYKLAVRQYPPDKIKVKTKLVHVKGPIRVARQIGPKP